jgi:hypothetical protein
MSSPASYVTTGGLKRWNWDASCQNPPIAAAEMTAEESTETLWR